MSQSQLASLSDDEIRDLAWYYQIELRPGAVTKGRPRGNLSLTRSQMQSMQVAGQRCLDIGTQEAVNPTLLSLAGASQVVCYDRLNLSDRIAMVQEAYNVDFDYIHSRQLHELPAELEKRGNTQFDVVIFAGVLYHMIDPLGGLGLVRGMVRQNGLVLVETSAIFSEELVLHFNEKGRFYEGSNYFQPTTATLDYFLRMLRLQVLDCRYTGAMSRNGVGRISVVCRALDAPLPARDDGWMEKPWVTHDMKAVSLDYDRLQSELPPVEFEATTPGLCYHDDHASVDLTKTLRNTRAFKPSSDTSQLLLKVLEGQKRAA